MSIFSKKEKVTYSGEGETLARRFWRGAGELIQVALLVTAIVLPVRYFLVQPFYVEGASMEPTFFNKEYLVIDELSYRLRQPERGEVVVLRYPSNPSLFFIKRIIGLPGDMVRMSGGKVSIQPAGGTEAPLDESQYLPSDVQTIVAGGDKTVTLGADEYYVMGDNRGNSLDSRIFGVLPKKDIVGRVMLRGWPLDRLGWFEPPVYKK